MADNINFFEDKTVEENKEPQVPESINVGGVDYAPGELEKLVGLGKIGAEAEEKFKTKIDRVWPEFTKGQQKIADLEAKLAEREQVKVQEKQAQNQPLSADELKTLARQQGRDLGIMFQEDFDQLYLQRRSAEKLIDDAEAVAAEAETNGKPKTSVEAILKHMQDTGIKNPVKAYNDLYEPELDKWKQEQMTKVKPQGVYSVPQSVAGGKQPTPVKVTKDNLGALVAQALAGE